MMLGLVDSALALSSVSPRWLAGCLRPEISGRCIKINETKSSRVRSAAQLHSSRIILPYTFALRGARFKKALDSVYAPQHVAQVVGKPIVCWRLSSPHWQHCLRHMH